MVERKKSPRSKDKSRFVLRSETAIIHDQLHQVACFQALFEGTLTLDQYVALIERMHGFYADLDIHVETACSRYGLPSEDFDYAPRAELFARDLEALGLTREKINSGAKYHHPGPIESAECLSGVLYVIEGSVLGGAVIAKALQGLPAPEPVRRQNYWTWCQTNGAHRWAMTLRMLDDFDQRGADREAMVDSAKSTFAAMHDWLSPLGSSLGAAQRHFQ